MSNKKDTRIVEMQFNNKDFEKNAEQTLKVLQGLDANLNGDRSGISKNLDFIASKFTAMGTAGRRAIENITDAAMGFGRDLMNQFVFDPPTSGFQEYETKMSAVQTIMASTRRPLEDINAQLDELNKYADLTKYVFTDMTQNIGKFTNAGVKLEPAVNAIKGVSNLAALSGASAEQASHAMYNFAQSLSQGYVGLIDWKSINVAGMDTVEFKQELLDMAEEMGTVVKVGDKYVTTTTNAKGEVSEAFDATTGWNQALQYQWITADVLTDTLNRYADTSTDVGKRATEAATKIFKFTEMMDALRETVGSGWTNTWEKIFGDFNEAADLWTTIYKFFNQIFEDQANARNSLLESWRTSWGGAAQIKAIVQNVLEGIKGIFGQIREAWASVFPPTTAMDLNHIAGTIQQLTGLFKKWTTESDTLKRALTLVFKAIKVAINIFKIAWSVVKGTYKVLKPIGGLLLKIFEIIDGFLGGIFGSFADNDSVDVVTKITNGIAAAFDFLAEKLQIAVKWITDSMGDTDQAIEVGKDIVTKIKNFFSGLGNAISSGFTEMGGLTGIGEKISEIWTNVKNAIATGFDGFIQWAKDFGSAMKEYNLGSVLDMLNFGAVAVLVAKLNGGVKDFKKAMSAFKDLSKGLNEVLKGVSKVLKGFAKKLSAEANDINATALLKMAAAIAILTAALIALTFVDQEKLSMAVVVIGAIALSLAGLITALNKGNTVNSALNSVAKGIKAVLSSAAVAAAGVGLLAIAGGLLALLFAVRQFSKVDMGTILGGIIKMGIVLLVTSKALKSLIKNIQSDRKQISALGRLLVYVGVSALLLGAALKIFDTVSWDAIRKVGTVFLAMTIIMVTAFKKLSIIDPRSLDAITKGFTRLATGFAIVSASMLILIPSLIAFTLLAKFGGWDGVGMMAVTLTILTAAMIGLSYAVSVMGNSAKYFTKVALGMALFMASILAIALVAPIIISSGDQIRQALLLLVSIVCDVLLKSAKKIAEAVFSVINALLNTMEQQLPEITDSLFGIILGIINKLTEYSPQLIEALYNLVAGIVNALKKKIGDAPIDPKALAITVLSLIGLIKVIDLMAGVKTKIKDAAKVLPMMVILLAAVAGVFGLMALMGVDGATVRDQAIAVGMVMTAMGVALMGMSRIKIKPAKLLPMLLAMAVVLGSVAGVIGMFHLMDGMDGNKMLKQGVAVGLIMLAIGLVLKHASRIRSTKQGLGILAALGSFALIISALALMFNQMNGLNDLTSGKMVEEAVAIGIIIVAIGAAIKLMGNTRLNWKTALANAIQMGAFIAVLFAAGGALIMLDKNMSSGGKGLLDKALALSLILIAMGLSVKIMGNSNMKPKTAAANAIELGALCVALFAGAGALTILNNSISDTNGLLIKATALSEILLAMVTAVRILPKNGGTIKSAAATALSLGAVCVGLFGAGGALFVLQEWGLESEGLLARATALSEVLDAMAIAVRIVSGMKIGAAVEGAAGFDAAVLIITGLMGVLGSIQEITDGEFGDIVGGGLDLFIEICQGIGEAIGSLIGGLVGGIAEGMAGALPEIGTSLSEFAVNIEPFIALCSRLGENSDAISGAAGLAGVIAAFLGIEMLDAIASFFDFLTGGHDIDGVCDMLTKLGGPMAGFVSEIASAPAGAAESAAAVGSAIAALISAIPREGGFGDLLTGKKDLIKIFEPDESGLNLFGHMGQGILQFQEQAKGIDKDTVELASDCGKIIAEFAEAMPKTGGMVQLWEGNVDYDSWYAYLGRTAKAMIEFQENAKGLDKGTVELAASCGGIIAELAESLPKTGGIAQLFAGDVDYSGFYIGIPRVGTAIKEFSDNVDGVDKQKVANGSAAAEILVALSDKLGTDGGIIGNIVGFFTGTFDPDGFKTNITAVGEAVKNFNDNATGVNEETVKKGKAAAETLIELNDMMPDEEGFIEKVFGGKLSLSDFATQIASLGTGLKSFSDSTSPIDSTRVSAAVAGIKDIVDIANDIKGIKKKDFTNFNDAMSKLASEGISSFVSTFEGTETTMTNAVVIMVNLFSNAIDNNKDTMINKMSDVSDAMIDALTAMNGTNIVDTFVDDFVDEFNTRGTDIEISVNKAITTIVDTFKTANNQNRIKTAGIALINNLISGFTSTDSLSSMTKTTSKILMTIITKINSYQTKFHTVGKAIMKSFILGMNSETENLTKSANTLANAAYEAMTKTLDEHSPSKKTLSAGKYFTQGFIDGIGSLGSSLTNKVSTISTEAMSALYSAINDLEDTEWSPSIRPVMNMDNIESGVNWMNRNINDATIGASLSPTITRATTISTTFSGAATNAKLSNELSHLSSKLDGMPSSIEPIVTEIYNLRNDVVTMGEQMRKLKVVMNNGALVGQLAGPIDRELGKRVDRATRR